MRTIAMPKQQKKLSPIGRITTPKDTATSREMERISGELLIRVEELQGLCRTLGVFAWAENIDALEGKDIGLTAALMERTLDGIHDGLEKIEDLSARPYVAATI